MKEPRLNFRFLTGDLNWQLYGGLFISKQLHNGDWPYWFILEVRNDAEEYGKGENFYRLTLSAVAPAAVERDDARDMVQTALESGGYDAEVHNPLTDDMLVEAIYRYGICAPLATSNGTNLNALMKEMRTRAALIEATFGFRMDKVLNGIGMTGWDFIAGKSPLGFFKQAASEVERQGVEIRPL